MENKTYINQLQNNTTEKEINESFSLDIKDLNNINQTMQKDDQSSIIIDNNKLPSIPTNPFLSNNTVQNSSSTSSSLSTNIVSLANNSIPLTNTSIQLNEFSTSSSIPSTTTLPVTNSTSSTNISSSTIVPLLTNPISSTIMSNVNANSLSTNFITSNQPDTIRSALSLLTPKSKIKTEVCKECNNKIKSNNQLKVEQCCNKCNQTIIPKIDKILNKIRHNCVHLSIYHNKRYHSYKNTLFSVFRVPLIILAGCNSFIAVGMQNYLSQDNISIINALLSILCGVITSIELLLNLQKRMELELETYKNYYKLSIEIFRYIKLDPIDRQIEPNDYLPKIYELYENLITNSNAINVYRRGFIDEFEDVNDDILITDIPNNWYTYFCHCCY